MIRVPCTLFRAGTSKGPFFLKSDLPQDAHAVTGGLCLAAACWVEGSVAHQMVKPAVLAQGASEHEMVIEHLSGTLWTALQLVRCGDEIAIPLATFIRTVRPLFEGHVVVPLSPP